MNLAENNDYPFHEDVSPGGFHKRSDIRLAICYILSNVDGPMPGEAIREVFIKDRLANYFEIGQALTDLVKDGNIDREITGNTDYYSANENSRFIARELQTKIMPLTRASIIKYAIYFKTLEQRKKENEVKIEELENGGRNVAFSIKAPNGDTLISVTVYAGDMLQAEEMKNSFLKNPAALYENVLNAFVDNGRI